MTQALTPGQWAEIIDKYYADLYRFCAHYLNNNTQAEDITQDVFLKFYLALSHGQEMPEPRAWLYRVARNACIDRHRWWKRYARLFSSKQDCDALAQTGADASTLSRSLRTMIDRLPRRQKEVFILRHWHECSTEEAAKILGISVGSVKSHLSRAIAALRQGLECSETASVLCDNQKPAQNVHFNEGSDLQERR